MSSLRKSLRETRSHRRRRRKLFQVTVSAGFIVAACYFVTIAAKRVGVSTETCATPGDQLPSLGDLGDEVDDLDASVPRREAQAVRAFDLSVSESASSDSASARHRPGYLGSTYDEVIATDEKTIAIAWAAKSASTGRMTFSNRLSEAIAKGRVADAHHREEMRLAGLERREEANDRGRTSETAQHPPIVRFDFGFGLLHPVARPNITTGHSRDFSYPDADFEKLQSPPSNLAGDQPATTRFSSVGLRPRSQFGPALLAAQQDEAVGFLRPGCSDGRDNNANGFTDRNDPACWLDGRTPSSYSPWLSESEPVNVFGGLNRATTSAPSAPFAFQFPSQQPQPE